MINYVDARAAVCGRLRGNGVMASSDHTVAVTSRVKRMCAKKTELLKKRNIIGSLCSVLAVLSKTDTAGINTTITGLGGRLSTHVLNNKCPLLVFKLLRMRVLRIYKKKKTPQCVASHSTSYRIIVTSMLCKCCIVRPFRQKERRLKSPVRLPSYDTCSLLMQLEDLSSSQETSNVIILF